LRILIASDHRYLGSRRASAGLEPRDPPSGASGMVYDLLVRGLGELGHQVLYRLPELPPETAPEGVSFVPSDAQPLRGDVDVLHGIRSGEHPWIRTRHRHRPGRARRHDVFVSAALARRQGSRRFVHNGIDPAEYAWSEAKDDFLLFLAAMDGPSVSRRKYLDKGLDVALHIARRAGARLVVAGSAYRSSTIAEVRALCEEAGRGVRYVGDVRGTQKAELLAGARAVLVPSRVAEGFGMVVAEAAMSGTPVLASPRGALPELVDPEIGLVCDGADEFVRALDCLPAVSADRCRAAALARFHYRRMAADYVREYEREITAGP
jgi:glycosyltransferase involved in cell wall biosynthesis